MDSLFSLLLPDDSMKNNKTAIIFDSKHYTYADLYAISLTIANNLYHHGLRKNSYIAVFMNNRPELIWLYFSAFLLGITIVPINYRYKADELSYVLQDCPIDFLITEEEKEGYIEKLVKEKKLHCKVFSISDKVNSYCENFSSLLNTETLPCSQQEINLQDLALILYTSGSTANPKGVMHSYHSILSAAKQLIETIGQDQHCVSGVTLPICHIAGFIGQVIATILAGGKIILFQKFDSAVLVQAIQKYHITHLEMVPVNLIELVEFISTHGGDLKSLSCVMVGGDKVPENIQEKFFSSTGCHITEVMGMTESFSHCINLSHDLSKMGSFGQAAKGATVTLMDEQDQPILKKNIVGEVVIQSEANMIGYWNNTAETEKTLRNGSVYSGDLAYQDSDDYFWFIGRKKNLIVRGGSNISPQEIENVLMTCQSIAEVCVIGFPDKKFNQIICACVVLHDKNTLLTLNDIRIFCQNKLSDYKIPEKLIILKELPHNATGKIDRKKTADNLDET